MASEELEDFKKRVRSQLDRQLSGKSISAYEALESRQYEEFKEVYKDPKHSLYEKWCNIAEKLLHIKDPKNEKKIAKDLSVCHLSVTPSGVLSLAAFVPLVIIMFSIIFGYVLPNALTGYDGYFFVFIGLLAGLVFYPVLMKVPTFLSSQWRMAASNQMVLCVFYVVTYMRHTSNLELAIDFAAEHLTPPLALDLKKVIWNVETGVHESVKESLDEYLDRWKETNMEFVESMHLIESSLYESAEDRRISALEKSLNVILSETYEKMLHYAQNLKSPLNMLNMLGIVLPVLGLVILPLAVSFMEGIRWYHIMILYNIVLPISVYYLSKTVLSQRPTGYGQTDISKYDSAMRKQANIVLNFGKKEVLINPIYQSLIIGIIFILIGLLPIIIHSLAPTIDPQISVLGFKMNLLDYRDTDSGQLGPFSLLAAFISFFIPMGIGLSIGYYNKARTKNILKIRNASKKLELEFASAIFQLGNRIGDGLPLEISFSKVADVMQGTISGEFFESVSSNITKLGMGVEEAIFNKEHGALKYYPSSLIESSMKVLIESAKKGPMIASQSLVNISEYIRQMHRVDERLKDLMADTISSMKSQVGFLAPVIAGIVIGITSMITTILVNLSDELTGFLGDGDSTSAMGTVDLTDMFGLGVPTFFFQAIVGVYVVQIVYILTFLINGIENGNDELNGRYLQGKNLIRSVMLYCILGAIVMVLFNVIAQQALPNFG